MLLAHPQVTSFLAQLASPLNDVIFCLHQEKTTYLSTSIGLNPMATASLATMGDRDVECSTEMCPTQVDTSLDPKFNRLTRKSY